MADEEVEVRDDSDESKPSQPSFDNPSDVFQAASEDPTPSVFSAPNSQDRFARIGSSGSLHWCVVSCTMPESVGPAPKKRRDDKDAGAHYVSSDSDMYADDESDKAHGRRRSDSRDRGRDRSRDRIKARLTPSEERLSELFYTKLKFLFRFFVFFLDFFVF